MQLEPLTAVSPIDGRYRSQLSNADEMAGSPKLDEYFSEYALIRYRVRVEVEYLLLLADKGLLTLSKEQAQQLRSIYQQFSMADAKQVKAYEKTTNHDVKAVEYFLKDCIDRIGLSEQREWVHFGLTSQDINNTAVPLSWREALEHELYPRLEGLTLRLANLASEWQNIPMLARTHGQPASPTRLGKEFMVFVERLRRQSSQLQSISTSAKFGGATGNFNAHQIAYPHIDWIEFGNQFVNDRLGLRRQQFGPMFLWTTLSKESKRGKSVRVRCHTK
jgi:adenylosuccinate lyase